MRERPLLPGNRIVVGGRHHLGVAPPVDPS